MRLPERQQYVSQTLVVPKKNRMAIMVSAERTNFGGDLQLAFDRPAAGHDVRERAVHRRSQ